MSEVVIKSSETAAKLTFLGAHGDYFTVRFESPVIHFSKEIWGYTDCEFLVQLFEYMAVNWQGWKGKVEWSSIECDLQLCATADSLGHTTLEIVVQENDGPEKWQVKTELKLNTTGMDIVAKEMSSFFDTPSGL